MLLDADGRQSGAKNVICWSLRAQRPLEQCNKLPDVGMYVFATMRAISAGKLDKECSEYWGEMKERSDLQNRPDPAAQCLRSFNLAVQQDSPIMLSYHLYKPQSHDESLQDHPRRFDVSCDFSRAFHPDPPGTRTSEARHIDNEACLELFTAIVNICCTRPQRCQTSLM